MATPSADVTAPDTTIPITYGDIIFLQSYFNKYLCVNNFGRLACNRDFARDWEQFTILQAGNDPAALGKPVRYNDLVHLRTRNHKYVTATDAGKARCNTKDASAWETFIITSPLEVIPEDTENYDGVIYNTHQVAFLSTSHLTFLSPTKTGKIRANMKGDPGAEQCLKLLISKRYAQQILSPNGALSPQNEQPSRRRAESGTDFYEDSDDEETYDYSSPLGNFASFSNASTTQLMKKHMRSGLNGNVQRYTKQAAQLLMIDHMASFPTSQQKLKYVRDVCEQNAQNNQTKKEIFTTGEIIAIVETFPVIMHRMEALRLLCTRLDTSKNVLYFTARDIVSLIRPYTMSHLDRLSIVKLCALGFNNPNSDEIIEILEQFQAQTHRIEVIKTFCKIEPEQDESYILADTANFKKTVLEYEDVLNIVDLIETMTHKKQIVNYLVQSKRFTIAKVETDQIVKHLTRPPSIQ
jgi:hypothetical protein